MIEHSPKKIKINSTTDLYKYPHIEIEYDHKQDEIVGVMTAL